MGFSLDISVPILTVFVQGLLSFFSAGIWRLGAWKLLQRQPEYVCTDRRHSDSCIWILSAGSIRKVQDFESGTQAAVPFG